MAGTPFGAQLVASGATYTVPGGVTAFFNAMYVSASGGVGGILRINGVEGPLLGVGLDSPITEARPLCASAGDVISVINSGGATSATVAITGNLYATVEGVPFMALVASSGGGGATYTVPASKRIVATAFLSSVSAAADVFFTKNTVNFANVRAPSLYVAPAKAVTGTAGDVFGCTSSTTAYIALIGNIYDL
jgi:hypothetical protein